MKEILTMHGIRLNEIRERYLYHLNNKQIISKTIFSVCKEPLQLIEYMYTTNQTVLTNLKEQPYGKQVQ